ncbi:DUF6701 domain-containing protein [Vibrio sp. CK2-1]|uniref:DUF6701 domain-containing protein n=1 Tax=Vibrio sp. CK2-1 TaxID=2912249 RepID=UPI001F3095DA|nr:DUF6701 domain-containing protein [Vibrio sp. CK2-1]MCF7353833.1 hypothetical protein [Vibrio sp. CK2-1]
MLTQNAWADNEQYEQYFPQALQSWKGANSHVSFENSMQVQGFTDDYVANNQGVYNDGSGDVPVILLGFDEVGNGFQTAHAASCADGFGCAVDSEYVAPRSTLDAIEGRKAPTPEPVLPPATLPKATLSVENTDTPCSDESLCHTEIVDGVVNLYIDADLASLHISVYSGTLPINIILSGNRYIGDIHLESNETATLVFSDDMILTTDTMVWGNGAVVSSGYNVLVKVINEFSAIATPRLTTTHPIFYYAPTGTISISATSGGDYYGCLLADTIQLNNKLTINGAVTARVFDDSTGSTITGNGACVASIPDPDPEPEPLDMCTLFPSAVQSNDLDSDGNAIGKITLTNGDKGNANRLYLTNKSTVLFGSKDIDFDDPDHPNGCVYGNNGSFDGQPVEDCTIIENQGSAFPDGIPEFDAFEATGDSVKWEKGSDELYLEPGHYSSLTISGNNDGETKGVTLNEGEYWIGQIKFESGSNHFLRVNGRVVLHYNKMGATADGVYVNANPNRRDMVSETPDKLDLETYSPENLILIGHGSEASFDDNQPYMFFNAHWYISPESKTGFKIYDDNNPVQIVGSISAANIEISDSSEDNYIYAKGALECEVDPVTTQNIAIDIDKNVALTCQTPVATITVTDQDGNPQQGNVNVSISPDSGVTLGKPDPDAGNGTFNESDGTYTTNEQGILEIPLEGDSATFTTYTVTASLVDSDVDSVSDTVEYVPFALSADEQHVIANKPQSVDVKVLTCDSGEEVAVNYSGTPTISHELNEPADGVGKLTFEPDFKADDKGEVSTDLTFTDSGKVTVTMTDDNFKCTEEQEDCPIDGKAELKGSFTVYSRPWTFAICDAEGSAMDGNIDSSGSLGFKAAGEEFDLHVLPLRWVSGETDPVAGAENIDVTELCDKPITQNYLSSDSLDSTIQLSYELAQPSPDIGHEGSLSGTQSLANTDSSGSGESGYYDFSQLAWSEVGVLKVSIDAEDNYYEMNINQGYRNIGRFYPDHLSIIDNQWMYQSGLDSFAYMNQPIHMDYTVEAQNTSGGATENYGDFADDLQAKLKLVGTDTDNNTDLVNRFTADEKQDWDGADYFYSTDSFVFYKQQTADDAYTTEPDGPYSGDNSDWGIKVTDATTDNVDFYAFNNDDELNKEENDNSFSSFSGQPNFRYGRMILDSVSSPIGGPVSIPLRAEYWSGNGFNVNTEDSGSQFEASVYCAIDEETTAANDSDYLTDTKGDKLDKVDEGKSSVVRAGQESAKRETVRIFMRQGNQASGEFNNPQPETTCNWHNDISMGQPWMQYNWRNKGDEDPSTVVNFGSYRGNDRIIFRGEEQLTEN